MRQTMPEAAMTDWHDDGEAANAHAQLQQEREEAALKALMACKQAGAFLEDIETLAAELGLRNEWKQYEASTQP